MVHLLVNNVKEITSLRSCILLFIKEIPLLSGKLPSETITSGDVCQGCSLSSFPFNFVVINLLEITLSSSEFSEVGLLPEGSLYLEYTDDVVLFSENADEI